MCNAETVQVDFRPDVRLPDLAGLSTVSREAVRCWEADFAELQTQLDCFACASQLVVNPLHCN
jgi:hypothetical protein